MTLIDKNKKSNNKNRSNGGDAITNNDNDDSNEKNESLEGIATNIVKIKNNKNVDKMKKINDKIEIRDIKIKINDDEHTNNFKKKNVAVNLASEFDLNKKSGVESDNIEKIENTDVNKILKSPFFIFSHKSLQSCFSSLSSYILSPPLRAINCVVDAILIIPTKLKNHITNGTTSFTALLSSTSSSPILYSFL